MGNCQAIDAAALVIQHPCGKMDRLYWSVPVSEVMRMNPGHCISLIILLPDRNDNPEDETVRFTRVKLLRPGETLTLGHAYCLVTSHEVMEVLRAKKYAKPKRQQHLESSEKLQHEQEQGNQSLQSQAAMTKHERRRPTIAPANAAAMSSKSWRPSLQSTSESST
ncbi:uncharacterized protein LOC120125251 [Hibiscus syriacus]|uniref:uncharacterized protein LOC120125251 n=1 Tax=Hibiscus syriacus TaxID=106335 RepID=UPI0019245E63|nr:uncharacterized protein LOC120125251 [Hibiscus syriacus]